MTFNLQSHDSTLSRTSDTKGQRGEQQTVSTPDSRPVGAECITLDWLDVIVLQLSECSTMSQIFDCDNEVFSVTDIVGLPVIVTSVRAKKSDHLPATYAIAGFVSETLGDGLVKIGGNAARQLIHADESQRLPLEVTLTCKLTGSGRPFYKWK